MEIDFAKSASLNDNRLSIGVENLGELQDLIDNVQEKEKALHEAVRKLQQFNLEISFSNE